MLKYEYWKIEQHILLRLKQICNSFHKFADQDFKKTWASIDDFFCVCMNVNGCRCERTSILKAFRNLQSKHFEIFNQSISSFCMWWNKMPHSFSGSRLCLQEDQTRNWRAWKKIVATWFCSESKYLCWSLKRRSFKVRRCPGKHVSVLTISELTWYILGHNHIEDIGSDMPDAGCSYRRFYPGGNNDELCALNSTVPRN